MKRLGIMTVTGLTVAFAILVVGCSDSGPSSPAVVGDLTLDEPYGGYDATGEVPAFGQETVAGFIGEGEEVTDPALPTVALDSLHDRRDVKAYALTVRWGMLEGDSTVTAVTDWSGAAILTRGAVAVRRLIRFERNDQITRPRDSRAVLGWTAQTTVHLDGLLLTIFDMPPRDSTAGDNLLVLTVGAFTRTFNVSVGDLTVLDEIVDIGSDGNQVALNASALKPEKCAGGPLHGFWKTDSTGNAGRFFGVWAERDGRPSGHLKGHFGIRDGQKVLFGKIIGHGGEFLGRFRGHWNVSDDGGKKGLFRGQWIARNGSPIGELHGRWADRPPPEDRPRDRDGDFDRPRNGAGFFAGSWKKVCLRPDASSDRDPDEGP
jgi:hypothetical protein